MWHAMAKMKYQPREPGLWNMMENRVQQIAHTCIEQHLSNIMWIFATIGVVPQPRTLQVIFFFVPCRLFFFRTLQVRTEIEGWGKAGRNDKPESARHWQRHREGGEGVRGGG